MKLHRHQTTEGYYYQAEFSGFSLYAFKIREMVDQLFKIHGLDYRRFLFGEKLTKQQKFN